jgi:hypothetical protein
VFFLENFRHVGCEQNTASNQLPKGDKNKRTE